MPLTNICLEPSRRIIRNDVKDGSAAGVSGKPGDNGRFINCAVPLDRNTLVLDDELRPKGPR